jgi:3-dehydroquinate dehydratase I
MRKTYNIRGITVGEGKPKIIVPIIEKNEALIIEKAKSMLRFPIDVIEWRADAFEDVFDREKTLAVLRDLRNIFPNKILVFSFRTLKEGGDREISSEAYTQLNQIAAESGVVDMVDVALISCTDIAAENITRIHNAGVLVMGSYHNFVDTPEKAVLIRTLMKMQGMGADISKIAVMPNNADDLLTLLNATYETASKYGDKPIVATAMSPAGLLSRLAGEIFGSSMTYGAIGEATAPGQISVELLDDVLNLLHGDHNKFRL